MAGVLKLQRFIVPVLVLIILLCVAIEARPMHEHGSKIHHHRHQIHHHKEVHSHKYSNHRKAVPSPGGVLGHGFVDLLTLWGVKNSGPSPGAGH